MVSTRDVLAFGASDSYKTAKFWNNGFIKAIVLVLPNFTTASKATSVIVMDEESHAIYTNTNDFSENATHLISGISVPVDKGYSIKVTLNDVAGGAHNAVVKTYINTKE